MGGYGAGYLGWSIRTSDNPEAIAKAKDMHPKLAAGMYIFFALWVRGIQCPSVARSSSEQRDKSCCLYLEFNGACAQQEQKAIEEDATDATPAVAYVCNVFLLSLKRKAEPWALMHIFYTSALAHLYVHARIRLRKHTYMHTCTHAPAGCSGRHDEPAYAGQAHCRIVSHHEIGRFPLQCVMVPRQLLTSPVNRVE
eukprot:667936-Pelagomonas_calceolata.AAC.2